VLCVVFITAIHFGNKVIFLPVITADFMVTVIFLQCQTDYSEFLSAGDCIDSINTNEGRARTSKRLR